MGIGSRGRAPSIIAVALVCACTGDGPVGSGRDGRAVAALRLVPDAGLLEPGGVLALTFTAYDADGRIVNAADVEWTTADPAVATVDAAGRVTAHAPGSVDIGVRADSVQAVAAIAVLDAAAEEAVCGAGGPAVAVVVEADLAELIRPRLSRFQRDLCDAGYRVRELRSRFRRAGELRAWLAREHERTGGALEGVILVGDLPRAYQWITLNPANPSLPDFSEEAISFQYYADLDGRFSASPGHVSPGGRAHSYDLHTGATDWEIWVGVLPVSPGGSAATVQALNDYLDRNHAWRNGGHKPPRAFMQISEHFTATTAQEHAVLFQAMRTGMYAWEPFSAAPDAHLYFDSPPAGLDIRQGYDALERGVADFVVLDAHGFFGASGLLTIEWARTRPIGANFFWSNGCAVGDLDHVDNFLTAVLYGPYSEVLVAKGTTNDSGGMGNNRDGFFGRNIATAMSAGANLGQALLAHVNVPLIEPWAAAREFHFATAILLGDPTLRITPP